VIRSRSPGMAAASLTTFAIVAGSTAAGALTADSVLITDGP
jgi:hypothetical protein